MGERMTPAMREEMKDPEFMEGGGPEFRKQFARMGRDGWISLSWPKSLGGSEATPMEQYIFTEEVMASEFPYPFLTTEAIGPVLNEFGSQTVREEAVRGILRGETVIAIGYSEPGAGTDLASLTTRAERHGDGWVINGQKMWTSLANFADYVWLAARTDPDPEKKHKGLTMFLVPTSAPGFSATPVWTLGCRTNATYFDNVRLPDSYRVGEGTLGMAEASAAKVYGTEFFVEAYRLLLEVMGQAGTICEDSPGAILQGKLEQRYRVGSILTFGGGCNEVQRDIISAAGLLGLAVDEEYGGMGYGFETLCLLVEEVGRHVAAAPVVPVLVSAGSTLQRHADKRIRKAYLPALARGESLLTAALIEPASEDPERPECQAQEREGRWHITGSKHCVPVAARAQRVLLTARAGEELLLFLVDPQAAGVRLEPQSVTAGEPQYLMSLEAAPCAELLARGEQARTAVRWMNEATAAAYSAMATGLCEQILQMTARYTSERQQFGVPVATFQAVGHRAADAFIDVECLRLLSQQAVSLLDRDQDATEAVQVARVWTGDVTHRVSQSAQHLHGGIGVDRDYPLFRYCLWARQIELTAGNSAAQLAALGERIAEQFSTPTPA